VQKGTADILHPGTGFHRLQVLADLVAEFGCLFNLFGSDSPPLAAQAF